MPFYEDEDLVIKSPVEETKTQRRDLSERQMFKNGDLNYTTQQEKTDQDIRAVLSTLEGTCFMNPTFGSKVPACIFEQNSNILADKVSFYGRDAINKCIDYIICLDILVDTESSPGLALLQVIYKYKDTGIQAVTNYSLIRKISEVFND